MNDVEPEGDNRPDEELDTTAPNPPATEKPAGGWAMPEPTFQQTSGYLPQGYVEQVGLNMSSAPTGGDEAVSFEPEPPAEIRAEAFAAAVNPDEVIIEDDVEPQPDLIAQLEEEPEAFAPAATAIKDNGSGRSVVMLVLGLIAMVLFIVAFLAVIYFLFIVPSGGGSQF